MGAGVLLSPARVALARQLSAKKDGAPKEGARIARVCYGLPLLLALLTGAYALWMLSFAAGLESPAGDIEWFASDTHMFKEFSQSGVEPYFGAGASFEYEGAHVTWGVEGIDRSTVNRWRAVDYRGDVKLEYDLRRDWENCEMRTFLVAF